ncbi:unnamed protein product [Prorocentrum cordatum]|uniref:Ankyrin repeat domain-containing protein n=1 Tax=Prorocentrum cordatum TaxID=2364126 RepID=A0ABN9VA37_9DINO|nr:unnamed protein product [Polarella glacialis]
MAHGHAWKGTAGAIRSEMRDAWAALEAAARAEDASAAEGHARRLLGDQLPDWRRGRTPLMVLPAKGPTEIARQLVESGSRSDERCGWTVLMGTAAIGPMEIARLLVEAGADVNATDGEGRTALIRSGGARPRGPRRAAARRRRRRARGGPRGPHGAAAGRV